MTGTSSAEIRPVGADGFSADVVGAGRATFLGHVFACAEVCTPWIVRGELDGVRVSGVDVFEFAVRVSRHARTLVSLVLVGLLVFDRDRLVALVMWFGQEKARPLVETLKGGLS